MATSYPDELWQSLADLSGLLLSEENVETTLRRVADLAVRSIPGCDAVGVTLLHGGEPATHAATGGLVYEVDHFQYEIGEGPCLQAVQDGAPVDVQDMAASERFSRFCQHAVERGIHSSLSLPLVVRNDAVGALNLYSRERDAFSATARETALIFATQAAVALANTQTHAASVRLSAQLQDALTSRAVIDQAKGILMARNDCDEDGAFEMLRRVSQRGNEKVRLVAQRLVEATKKSRDTPG